MGFHNDPESATIEVLRYGLSTGREWLRQLKIVEIGRDELKLDGVEIHTVYPALRRLVRNGIVRQGQFVIPNGWLLDRDELIETEDEPGVALGPADDAFLKPYKDAAKVRTSMGKRNPHLFHSRYRLSQYGETIPIAQLERVENNDFIPGIVMPTEI